MNSLYIAKTPQEIINIIHPTILSKIPSDKLQEIAENILLFEQYFRSEVIVFPHELKATRIYSLALDKITQIDFEGQSYKL